MPLKTLKLVSYVTPFVLVAICILTCTIFLEKIDDDSQCVPQMDSCCVDTSTICSTSSDQDPTLPSAVNKIRNMGTRKRRESVAVWTDPTLLAFAEHQASEQTWT